MLGVLAAPSAAQQPRGPGSLVSNVAQVQLIAIVPPGVTVASPSTIRELSHTRSTRLLAAPLGVRVNAPYRVLIQRAPDRCRSVDAAERRVWVRIMDGAFTEVTTRQPASAHVPLAGSTPAEVVLQYRVSNAAAACDMPVPVSYEIHVAPTF